MIATQTQGGQNRTYTLDPTQPHRRHHHRHHDHHESLLQ